MSLPWGVSLGISSTISSKSITIKSWISGRTSSGSTSITLGILRRTLGVAKEELGFWSYRDLVVPSRLTFNFGNSSQALTNGNFGPLSKELYDLGNILELDTKHGDIIRIGFLE
jgi:hypothetical protein